VYWSFAVVAVPIAFFTWSLPSPQPRAVPEAHQDAPFPVLPVIIMVLCFAVYVGMEVGYGNWIYAYAFKLNMGTEITANYLTSAFWGFFTLGRLLGIWVSTRLRPLSILYLDFIGCIFSVGLILLFRESTVMLWIGTILLGVSLASIFPTLLALAEERIHITGTITGLFLVGGSLGSMLIPPGIGQAFDRIGPSAMVWIVFTSIVLNLGFIVVFTRLRSAQAGDESLAES
jgi:FHS family Na+ dependent glucose MFS transporter 1